jgi:DNA-binding protein H-NS
MAEFNIEALSLKELKSLQKDLAKAISTLRTGRKAMPAASSRSLPKRWAIPWPT